MAEQPMVGRRERWDWSTPQIDLRPVDAVKRMAGTGKLKRFVPLPAAIGPQP